METVTNIVADASMLAEMVMNLSTMVMNTGEMVNALSKQMMFQGVAQTLIIVVVLFYTRRRDHD